MEVGGDRVTVLRQLTSGDDGFDPTTQGEKTHTAMIVLCGATSNHLDDLERAIDVLLQLIVQRPYTAVFYADRTVKTLEI